MPLALRTIALAVMRPVPLRLLSRLDSGAVVGLCYHAVCERELPHVRHLTVVKKPHEFEHELNLIKRTYRFVSYADIAGGQVVLGDRRPRAVLTFDDGLRECFEVVRPLLLKHGVPAIFFVTTSFIDNRRLFYRHGVSLCIEGYLSHTAERRVAVRRELSEILGGPIENSADFLVKLGGIGVHDDALLNAACLKVGADPARYLSEQQPYLSSEQIGTLAAEGFTIGAHGCSHAPPGEMTGREFMADVIGSCGDVRRITGATSIPYAFPFDGRGIRPSALCETVEADPRVGLFFDTQGIGQPDPNVVNRVVADRIGRKSSQEGDLAAVLKLAYAKRAVRRLTARHPLRARHDTW